MNRANEIIHGSIISINELSYNAINKENELYDNII